MFLHRVLSEAAEPARAVFPLAVYLAIFPLFAQLLAGVPCVPVFKAEMAFGIPTVVMGLALFKQGLRTGLMPLGEDLGKKLPTRTGPAGVSVVCFFLAIGLTFAEPAIGALQEAAALLDAENAKLLATLFGNPWCTLGLVLVIGVGVGIAAVTGSLRLLYGWGIKPMIAWALVPCILGTLFCGSTSGDLKSIVGLAWDSGAVTTGPVTVPVVISLGIGLASAKRLSFSSPQVELSAGIVHESLGSDLHMVKDVMPGCSGLLHGESEQQCSDHGDDLHGFGIVTFASLWPVLGVLFLGLGVGALQISAGSRMGVVKNHSPDAHTMGIPEFTLALQSVVPLVIGLLALQKVVIAEPISNLKDLSSGICCVFFGLALFNIGLNFGLLPLGDGAGEQMAISFAALVRQDRFAVGVTLMLCFAFLGTFAAQVAEPSLNVLGETVERLTRGRFPRMWLVYVVALGVASGTCVGVLKVLWSISIWMILLPAYSLAMLLTLASTEGITCVAWDAGGVTTGSVTVPLILAMGLGLGRKCDPPVADGFGLLGCASVFPIITVLTAGLILDQRSSCRGVSRQLPILGSAALG